MKKIVPFRTYHKIFLSFVVLGIVLIACLHFYPDFIYQYYQEISLNKLNQWQDKDRPTLIYSIPSTSNLGETEYFHRLVLSAKKMGWNVLSEKKALTLPVESLRNAFGFVIYNTRIFIPKPYSVNFPINIPIVLIYDPITKEMAKDPIKHLKLNTKFQRYIKNYSLLGLLAVSPSPINISGIDEATFPHLKFIMNWYYTSGATHFQPQANKLMYCGSRWDELRNNTRKYVELWEKLGKTSYFNVYGSTAWQDNEAYRGFITPDGKSFIKEINKNGICLVLHSDAHLKDGVPSARIFEAAAAAAVIISDKHPFIEREFKDSVLYIDQTREDLFEQIDAHMAWIKAHPKEALAKARLAHAIFLKNFTEEQQLAKLYEQLQSYKKQL